MTENQRRLENGEPVSDSATPVALEGGLQWEASKNVFGRNQWTRDGWTITDYDGHFSLMSRGRGDLDTLEEAKTMAAEIEKEIVARVLDGEPREPECPTNHQMMNVSTFQPAPRARAKATIRAARFCPDCGTRL